MNVVLIGMKHCGKSTVGRALAGRWGCAFHDVDEMMENLHACDSGRRQSVREIFAEHGEAYFHRIEGHAVCELYLKLDRPGSTAVAALGGRTALNTTISRLLQPIGPVVYLRVPPEELFARVERGGIPPFLDPRDPKGHFLRICNERAPEYERLANLVIDLDRLSVAEAVEVLTRRLAEHRTSSA